MYLRDADMKHAEAEAITEAHSLHRSTVQVYMKDNNNNK